jgi:hypothetical protein
MPETKPITEAERFRAFAKHVVNVPKKVVDRREVAYQKQRAAIRKARPA